jgi:uncharacterized protein YndB with AHSA1/START domain
MGSYSTSIDIEAPPDIVFSHLVRSEQMTAWMGQYADLDPRPGGKFVVDINGSPIRGSYVEVDPPNKVVVTWGVAGSEDHPPGSSRVEITLTGHDRGTRVELVHTDLPDERTAMHGAGWEHFLPRLALASTGPDPEPDSWAPWAAGGVNPR